MPLRYVLDVTMMLMWLWSHAVCISMDTPFVRPACSSPHVTQAIAQSYKDSPSKGVELLAMPSFLPLVGTEALHARRSLV